MSVHTDDKIRTVDELAAISAALKQQGKVIVHCHGVFDLLHPGHFRHFAAALMAASSSTVRILSSVCTLTARLSHCYPRY